MKIGNKERPAKFGMNSYIYYCELHECTMTQMSEDLQKISKGKGTGAEIRDIIWACLKSGDKEFSHDNLDVGDWMDELDPKELTNFFNELGKSMADRIPDDRKKKVKAVAQL